MKIVTRSYLLFTRDYMFKNKPLSVGFYESEFGKFAAIDPTQWNNGVHVDDYCLAALNFKYWLELNNHKVAKSQGQAIVENGWAPYFWLD